MGEVLERAARALQEWHSQNGKLRPALHEAADQARAVLQAIRTPSEAMNAAGAEYVDFYREAMIPAIWQAMIDSILEGK